MPAPFPRPVIAITRRTCCLVLFLYCILISPLSSTAQEYNYIRYDTKDGLAGSTVYDMVQDKEGFMWFATEAGLSRFDGTHFKNFTTADGLPDVEIIKLYVDYIGRVWIAPFKNTLCYYYKGKIHTAENDSLLKLVKLDGIISFISGDIDGNIFLGESRYGQILQTKRGHEKLIDLKPFQRRFMAAAANFRMQPGFVISTMDSSFLWRDGKLSFWQAHEETIDNSVIITKSDTSGHYVSVTFKERITANNYYKFSADSLSMCIQMISTINGAYLVDSNSFDRFEEHFLPGKKVNSAFIDFENNIWFGTTGEGAYKLTSRNFKTYNFPDNHNPEIFSLAAKGNVIFAGGGYNKLYEITGSKIKPASFLQPIQQASINSYTSNRLVSIAPVSNGNLVLGFDLFLYQKSPDGGRFCHILPVKVIQEAGTDTLLVATGRNVVRVHTKLLNVIDTIWPTRSTSVSYSNGQTYIGTVDGLYYLRPGQQPWFLGTNEPHLRYRIAAITRAHDGTIWVATFGGGIIGLKEDRVVARLTTHEGLTSDICRTLFAEKDFLWIGTDKGINKIDLRNLHLPPRKYSVADGLPSNIINAIYADSNRVYIGSPAGLTTFDEKQVSDFSRCDLRLLNLTVSDRSVAPDSIGTLAYNDNSIAIDFVAISYKSGGDILYRYRLKGLKDTWDSTRQNSLSYPTLPPGEYELEIVAINKFGVSSSPLLIPFIIEAPFWQRWWFLTLAVLLTIGLTALLVGARFSVLRKREREKASLEQKVSKLEQLALLSQMNPHFIFNCLNSIQAFIIQNDLETTNQYLSEFAHLIRQTMDAASRGTITLAEEVKYLTRYIDLERMRFGESFDFLITVDEQIDTYDLAIPSMILQPYVENSIRHGIRYQKKKRGLVEIRFRQYGSQLICTVEDNGIGREEALRLRSKVHVEYQSKGMSLAAERIQALNRQYGMTVTIQITDKADEQGSATGTRIEIGFPLSLLSKLS